MLQEKPAAISWGHWGQWRDPPGERLRLPNTASATSRPSALSFLGQGYAALVRLSSLCHSILCPLLSVSKCSLSVLFSHFSLQIGLFYLLFNMANEEKWFPVWVYTRSLANFFYKVPGSKYFMFSLVTIQLSSSRKAAMDNSIMNGYGCVLIIFYLTNQVVSWVRPEGYRLATSGYRTSQPQGSILLDQLSLKLVSTLGESTLTTPEAVEPFGLREGHGQVLQERNVASQEIMCIFSTITLNKFMSVNTY